jgi:adenylate kinase
MRLHLVLLGPPGAGKGTQAVHIMNRYSIPQISTGEILRSAIRNQTQLGLEAKRFMDQGELVPDAVVVAIVNERLKDADCQQGFLLDGFPRTIAQANELDTILSQSSRRIDLVINLEVSQQELIKRLSGRRMCPGCGKIYNIYFNPPEKNPGKCDFCQEKELYQRDDDKEEAIVERIRVYNSHTKPLIDYYSNKEIIANIDGTEPIAAITQAIFHRVDSMIS